MNTFNFIIDMMLVDSLKAHPYSSRSTHLFIASACVQYVLIVCMVGPLEYEPGFTVKYVYRLTIYVHYSARCTVHGSLLLPQNHMCMKNRLRNDSYQCTII